MQGKQKGTAKNKMVIFQKRKGGHYIQIQRTEAQAESNMEALQKDGWFPVTFDKPELEREEPATTDLD